MPPKGRIDYEEVRKFYREGMTIRVLAVRFGVSRTWISRIVHLEAGGPPSRPRNPLAWDKIQKLRGAGLTLKAIGERFGVDPTVIGKL